MQRVHTCICEPLPEPWSVFKLLSKNSLFDKNHKPVLFELFNFRNNDKDSDKDSDEDDDQSKKLKSQLHS